MFSPAFAVVLATVLKLYMEQIFSNVKVISQKENININKFIGLRKKGNIKKKKI